MRILSPNQNGFSLVELLIVISLIGIISSMATLGFEIVRRERLSNATKQVVADIQKARMDAVISKQSTTVMTGAGIRFNTAASTAYVLFNFSDSAITDFAYSGTSEEANPREQDINSSLSLQIWPDDYSSNLYSILIYDTMGFPRRFKPDGTAVPDDSDPTQKPVILLLTETNLNRTKCVVISLNGIREGNWYGATTTCSQQ